MIDKTGALYRLIIGQRSNGKTYRIIKKCLETYLKQGISSAYIRRYAEEIRPKFITELLSPHIDLIKKLSKNKYNTYVLRNGAFYLAHMDSETNEIDLKDSQACIFTVALNTWNTSKGADRGQLAYICFDEFMTRELYLNDEFVKFTNCLSSLIRDRAGTIVYMLANTVNKYSPYFEEMGLWHVDEQQQGTIELYTYNNDKLTVAVEYCLPSENTKQVETYYAFDSPALEMIKSGVWETDNYRHICDCTFKPTQDTHRLHFYVCFNNQIVVGELHIHKSQMILFYHPMGKSNYQIQDTDIVYTDKTVTNFYQSNSFNTTFGMPIQNTICFLMKTGRDYYSSNAVGEIVNNFKKWGERKT